MDESDGGTLEIKASGADGFLLDAWLFLLGESLPAEPRVVPGPASFSTNGKSIHIAAANEGAGNFFKEHVLPRPVLHAGDHIKGACTIVPAVHS